MTTPNHPTHGGVMPYQRYLNATHAARDQYLATTYHAHRKYLTGPWPDRALYQEIENAAWEVYYAAARAAWHQYTAEVSAPDPLPARTPGHTPTRDAGGEVWPADPPRPAQPTDIPVYPTDHRTDQEAHAPWVPTFNPYPISDESYLSITDPPDKPRDPRNPEGRI